MDDIVNWDRHVAVSVADSTGQARGRCMVRGPAGCGITALHGTRTLRFRCQGCLGRFVEDPERFLAGHTEKRVLFRRIAQLNVAPELIAPPAGKLAPSGHVV